MVSRITGLIWKQIWDVFEDKHLFHGNDPTGYNPNGTSIKFVYISQRWLKTWGHPNLICFNMKRGGREFSTEEGMTLHGCIIPEDEN